MWILPGKVTGSLALASLLGLSACTSRSGHAPPKRTPAPVSVTETAPPTPIQEKKVELGEPAWNPKWDQIVEQSLPPAMLSSRVPRDVRQFCPRFYRMSTLEKREFWAYFFQALAGAEAGLDPVTNVRHTEPEVAVRDGVTGKMVRSEGLLQLTYEDKERYGCDFNWQTDKKLSTHDPAKTILQPANNLKCGVKILDRQIIRRHKPLLSPTGYWSTLHPGTPDYAVFAKQMTNPPAACRLHAAYPKSNPANHQIARTRHAASPPVAPATR